MFTEQGISITFIFHVTSFFFFVYFTPVRVQFPCFVNRKIQKKKVTVGAELLNHDEICWNIFIKSFH